VQANTEDSNPDQPAEAAPGQQNSRSNRKEAVKVFKEGSLVFSFYHAQYSTQHHLPPLRFICVGRCRGMYEPRAGASFALAAIRSNLSVKSHLRVVLIAFNL